MVANKDIDIKNLSVRFEQGAKIFNIIKDLTIHFSENTFIGILGESGCGKSILGQAILGYLPQNTCIEGSIIYDNINILKEQKALLNFGIIPQNPSESLNPIRNIGKQMQDIMDIYSIKDKENLYKCELLHFFGLSDTKRILKSYPYELSGGMQQRVLCAMGLINNPKWILADEPTKGLDDKVVNVVYENLLKIKSRQQMGMMLITHDLALAKKVCDKVAIMYAGQIVEYGESILDKPKHPYTKAFLEALPENGFKTNLLLKPDIEIKETACQYLAYCKYAMPICREKAPEISRLKDREIRCFYVKS